VAQQTVRRKTTIRSIEMTDNGDDYTPMEDNEGSPAARVLRRRSAEESGGVTGRASARKKARMDSSQGSHFRLPASLETLVELKESLGRRLHEADYDVYTSLRVVKAALTLQEDYLLEKRKRGKDKSKGVVPPPRVRATICRLFGLSPNTYTSIVSAYIRDRSHYASGVDGQGRSGIRWQRKRAFPKQRRHKLPFGRSFAIGALFVKGPQRVKSLTSSWSESFLR
jgi:hypothetical protein